MSPFFENFCAVGGQVVILFLLIAIGALTRISKMFNDESIRGITTFLLTFVTFCLLVVSFQRDCSSEQLRMVGASAVIGIVFHAISIALAFLFIHDSDKSREIVLRFSVVFTNAGFMSLPLQQAVLGEDGVFCGAVVVGIFQLLCWTFGLWLMTGETRTFTLRRILLNPGILGIAAAMSLFLLEIRLPPLIADPCKHISNLNTPMAMIVIGYHLAGTKLLGIFRDGKALFATFLRLVVAPLLLVVLLWVCGGREWNRTLLVATVIAASAPTAAITTMFAVQYKRDVPLSVEIVSLSTLLSALTMPLVVALAETFLAR